MIGRDRMRPPFLASTPSRRLLLAGFSATLFAMRPAGAQQRPPRIGVLHLGSGPDPWIEGFQRGLRERGYVDGRNIIVEYRYAAGRAERLNEMVAELIGLGVQVLVGMAGPAVMAAKQKTSSIPIVMAVSGDPVGLGVVPNLSRPGGNITGISLMSDDLAQLRIALLKEAIPTAMRVAVLYNPGEPPTASEMQQSRRAARDLGVLIQPLEVRGPEELEEAFRLALREHAEGLITFAHGFAFIHRRRIVDLAARYRLPAMYGWREYVDEGGLMALGPNVAEMLRRAAAQVDLVLRGANPGQIPVEQPTKFELVINLKTAKALGIQIPEAILIRADEVIE